MGVYSYGYKAGKKILQKILKPQKTTGETINPFQRKTMRSDAAAKMGDIKVQLGKLKGGAKKLQTSMDDVRAAMRDRAKNKFNVGGIAKRKSNIQKIQEVFGVKKAKKKEKPKKRMMAMGGGFAGRRMGYKFGSNGSSKGKVPTTPKEKSFGMLSVKAKKDNNPNITFTDKIVGAKKT